MLTARAKGLSNWAIVWKHGLRNAMLPLVTLIALSLGSIVGGAIVVEYVFSLPRHRPGHRRRDRPPRLSGAAGDLPAADAVGDPGQLHRRPALLQARPAGDDVSRRRSPIVELARRGAPRRPPGLKPAARVRARGPARPAAGRHRPGDPGLLHRWSRSSRRCSRPTASDEQVGPVYAPPSSAALARPRRRRHRHAVAGDRRRPGVARGRLLAAAGGDADRRGGRACSPASSAARPTSC